MYSTYSYDDRAAALGDLGFSLKPPTWLRGVATKAWQGIKSGATLSVDPGTGVPIIVDLSDPASIAKLKQVAGQVASGTSISFGNRPPTVVDQASAAVSNMVDSVPGGMLTILGIAALGLFMVSRRR